MPMKYNEDTGIPYFVPDTAIELDEGVTPKPDVITSKSAFFRGDGDKKGVMNRPQSAEMQEAKGYGVEGPIPLGRLLGQEGEEPTPQPEKLDKDVATDSEIDELERLASEHSVLHWPMLLRVINRLRRAEGRAME